MKSRTNRGATFGLVAIAALVIIIVGVSIFFLAKIIAGGREVANATDAGMLNVAKNFIKNPSVSVDPEFADVTNKGPVSLINYNACVAKALLVALNAQAMGNGLALSHAGQVLAKLEADGRAAQSTTVQRSKCARPVQRSFV